MWAPQVPEGSLMKSQRRKLVHLETLRQANYNSQCAIQQKASNQKLNIEILGQLLVSSETMMPCFILKRLWQWHPRLMGITVFRPIHHEKSTHTKYSQEYKCRTSDFFSSGK